MFNCVPVWVATSLVALQSDRRGVTAMEYGLIAGLIAVVVVVVLGTVGGNLTAKFQSMATALT